MNERARRNSYVKVCGVTRVEDAATAIDLGVDALGLNFHPTSPRFVDVATARAIAELFQNRCTLVGVFVDRPTSEIEDIAHAALLDVVQLHGNESPETIADLAPLSVWKAFRIRDEESLRQAEQFMTEAEDAGRSPNCLLLDAYDATSAGGTGQTWDWTLATRSPSLLQGEWLLAGGLQPQNVEHAIRTCRPWGVDVASGVESAPGVKSKDKMIAFIEAVRRADSA